MDSPPPRIDDGTLSSLRHDLRQFVVAGLLLSRAAEEDDLGDDRRARLATIRTLFEQIRLLVDAIGETCPPTRLDIPEIVDSCVEVARATTHLDINARVARSATAYGDELMLRRALTNVLDNAARAVSDDGRIDVLVSDSGLACTIEVTDNGVGFGQARRGSGEGMSVIARAVRACHGRLEVVSGPAPGTTVRMILPSSRQVTP
jgi:signal transduction histidine kinase